MGFECENVIMLKGKGRLLVQTLFLGLEIANTLSENVNFTLKAVFL